jgi:polyhydroxybutyrate depolymerase
VGVRGVKRAAASIGALVLLGVAAWATGAFATRYAASPARTPCTVLTPGDHTVNVLSADGRLRPVLLHVPKTGAYAPLPLVIALHGAGENGPRFAGDTGFSKLADREKFLVAYPTAVGPNAFWDITGQQQDAPEEVEELERSLDALEGVACVDRSRVFVTGVSNGGGMTARLACELSDRLAGAAPVAGGYRALPPCHPDRPLPILEIHGTGDQVVPYGGIAPQYGGSVLKYLARWRRLDGCTGKARRSSPAPGVHEFAWKDCRAGTSVEHVRLDHQAHGWPGGPRTTPSTAAFSTTWRTWEFFRSLPPRAPLPS